MSMEQNLLGFHRMRFMYSSTSVHFNSCEDKGKNRLFLDSLCKCKHSAKRKAFLLISVKHTAQIQQDTKELRITHVLHLKMLQHHQTAAICLTKFD